MKMHKSKLLSGASVLPVVLGLAAGAVVLSPAVSEVPAYATCNPSQAAKKAACGACNPCAAAKKADCGACNPCAAQKVCNPCNPCSAAKQ